MIRPILVAALVVGCGGSKAAEAPDPVPVQETTPEPETQPTMLEPDRPDGKAIYERVCITCHGPTGDGKGLEQQLFSFGTPEDQWKNGPTEDGIVITLAQGTHDSSMQPFPEYGEAERKAVAAYVLDLRTTLLADEAE